MGENVTEFEQNINNIKVCLKSGNLAAEDADCLVVPEFKSGSSRGGVGYAIETADMGKGLDAYDKVASEVPLKDGDAIITQSGKPGVRLAHVATVDAREDSQLEVVNNSILKTLETAAEIGVKRIALPEIGTGIIGSLTQEQSAKAIFNAVYQFSQNNPSSSIEEVSFVVYHSSTEPAKRVLTEKSYIDFRAAEKGEKAFDLEEWVEGMGNKGTKKSKKSPTRDDILDDEKQAETEDIREHPQLKINELRAKLGIKTKASTITHETRHAENQRSISLKEARELGVKPHLKVEFSHPKWSDRPEKKVTVVYDENEVAQKRAEFKRKDLLNRATLVEVDYGANANWSLNVDTLCKKMEQVAKTGPVKAEESGRMFVAEKGSDLSQILHAWKEQAYKPWLEERRQRGVPAESMLDFLDMHDQETKIDVSASSYMQAAMVEQIIEHHPEHAEKISMLQLLNAYYKTEYGSDISEKILREFNNSAERFAKGIETFPPTLQNLATLNEEQEAVDFMLGGKFSYDAYKGGTLKVDFDKRIAEDELNMLQRLKPEDLREVSDKVISAGSRIAEKHKEAGNYGKLFLDEVKSRLAQGKIFDPRDNG